MNCSFCSKEIKPGTGLMFVKKDAKILHFCASKCRRNMLDLGRKPRDIGWTAEHKKAKAEAAAERKG